MAPMRAIVETRTDGCEAVGFFMPGKGAKVSGRFGFAPVTEMGHHQPFADREVPCLSLT